VVKVFDYLTHARHFGHEAVVCCRQAYDPASPSSAPPASLP